MSINVSSIGKHWISKTKNKTYEEIYGPLKAEQLRAKRVHDAII